MSRGLDQMIPRGLFSPQPSCDSVIKRVAWWQQALTTEEKPGKEVFQGAVLT